MKAAFILSRCKLAGSSRNVLEVSKYLSGWGHEMHIFANECDPVAEGVSFHKIPAFTHNFLLREGATTLLETLLMKTHRYDVTIAAPNRYFSPDICHVRILNKIDVEFHNKQSDLSSKATLAFEKYNLKKAKHIIAMSKAVKESIIECYGIPAENITVIYDGVSLKQFDVEKKRAFRAEIRNLYGIDEKEVLLLFAGNPFSRKGLEFLIRALPSFSGRRIRLLVLGKGDISPYMKIAEELGVAGKIVYAGFTTEIHKYFAASDIFVFPTLYEPFGLVITEAMASGLPVVTSACAGAAELIEDGKEGLLLKDPKDSRELVEKIKLLFNKEAAQRMGVAARKKAEQYTWERTAKEMLKVFEAVANKKMKA
jgi:UDP-glucose:(heptosyl)LPS alpha-1,3-glucosyltransferase